MGKRRLDLEQLENKNNKSSIKNCVESLVTILSVVVSRYRSV